MKISLNWLEDYVKIDKPAEQIAEILSDLGLPNEGIEHLDGDTVIDLEITSNRGDCLSHIGVARELAAATGTDLKLPAVNIDESQKNAADLVGVEILSPNLCGRYIARVIEGVKVGPSPKWMVKRLEAVGLRSVNNVVDATNYAMMEAGQPPHAFDYDKIADHKIIVRNTKPGETLVSIDGTRCELTSDMLVIADPKGPVAIAGVMGGLNTEVGNSTTKILLEEAHFDPLSIRTTSRTLNLPSEAAYRFERIVDVENIDWASKRTAQLIVQTSGGRIAKGAVDVFPKKTSKVGVKLRLERLKKLLGIDVSVADVLRILSALQFQPKQKGDTVLCTVPSWRSDVYREADLIEEVARVYGYNKVPAEKKISIEVKPTDDKLKITNLIRTYLNGCGLFETITLGFVDNSTASLFGNLSRDSHLSVSEKLRPGPNLLRQTLIASLLDVLKTNINVKSRPCRIYEIADTFLPTKQGSLPDEKTKLAIVYDGSFRELKGVIEGLIKSLNSRVKIEFQPQNLIWAYASASIIADNIELGSTGIISPKLMEKFDFPPAEICAAELDLEKLFDLCSRQLKYQPVPRFPAVARDLSIIVDENIPWSKIEDSVYKKAPDQLEEVRFVEVYRGKNIPQDKKSIMLSLLFRDDDGTLTHDTVDRFQADIVDQLSRAVGAQLRTA
jgi:phenylalanyl-tRNA synthetase beta chain